VDVKRKYRGREVTADDITFIRHLIAKEPGASRRALSKQLCEAWNWAQPNGALRDMVCRSLMLELDRAGLIKLPPVRCRPTNHVCHRRVPDPVAVDTTPLHTALADLQPLEFRQVRRTEHESLFGALLQPHHYLGYTRPVGEHLKYLIYAKGRPIACFAWSSAPRHLGPRDRFIGWSAQARRQNVDPERFHGTCYRAANWRFLGRTTGRGKADQTHQPNRSCKEVLGYPLTADFRSRLGQLRPVIEPRQVVSP
jgi:hypothetical protein